MTQIFQKLFIGTWVEARSRAFLKKNRISHILITAPEVEKYYDGKYNYKVIP